LESEQEILELEILKALQLRDLRPRELIEKLYPQFKKAQNWSPLSPNTFRVQLIRRLKNLVKNEEVERIDKGHQNVSYSITSEGKRSVLRRDLTAYVSKLDEKNLEIFRKVMTTFRERQGSIENLCFAFIGDAPVGFDCDEESFKKHLNQKAYFQKRHQQEIERVRAEVEKQHHGEPISTWKNEVADRVEKEVGWSLGDYFRRSYENASKQKDGALKLFVESFTWDQTKNQNKTGKHET
jgi:hypothetical protein